MNTAPVDISGIKIPFSSPVLLAFVAIHVLAGLACVVTGIGSMLAKKGPGRHPAFGKIYFNAYAVIFITTAILSIARWREDYYLLVIGGFAFAAALIGRQAVKHRAEGWQNIHITGMVMSFILLLTAFYLDNGRNLPVWKDMPSYAYWLLPNAVGIPLIIYAIIKYRNFKYNH